MSDFQWVLVLVAAFALLVLGLWAIRRVMQPFLWRIVFCTVPLILAGWVVARAGALYQRGEGGFKLGVDLVGGTILVYEVDESKPHQTYTRDSLAASLKQRIDPADLYNVTIRPVSDTRVEIVLPTGGKHQAEAEEAKWDELLDAVRGRWPEKDHEYNVSRGDTVALGIAIRDTHKDATDDEVSQFIGEHYKRSRSFSSEQIQIVKDKISQVGLLEFRILANQRDDKEGIDACRRYLEGLWANPQTRRDVLEKAAEAGQPPPTPDQAFTTARSEDLGRVRYAWVEIGRIQRSEMELSNAAEKGDLWQRAAKARDEGKCLDMTNYGETLLYSRRCLNLGLPDRDQKKFEYFFLTRVPDPGTEVTGKYLVTVNEGPDEQGRTSVHFRFDSQGGALFYNLTSKNRPSGSDESAFKRHLAIVLDYQIISAPTVNSAISTDGQISGKFTKDWVDRLVANLRSGALPATLKPQPVSESTMGATLGEDTIRKGTYAVALAFVVILIFMLVYYRFAGLVACIALLANLLLTVAFMVLVNATFTLPGLAGLVLMLGMAVDANVLIYERLREERDRGAGLALAIRNGYDRAFPTIIDTHLSSIFTAIVLYAVGNDQLKGFGVSLTVGLIISLFTSLYMTRLLFDVWLNRGWLTKLSMFRLFSRPNINFMGIRYYWFTATIVLTVVGISVFILRLPEDLNIDFTGGTLFGGRLVQAETLGKLREQLNEDQQKKLLAIAPDGVKQLDAEGRTFQVTYADGATRTVSLPNSATPEEVRARAQVLPDVSVEQIFPGSEVSGGNASRHFNVRTPEKAANLVQTSIGRLLGDSLQRNRMKVGSVGEKAVTLTFTEPASPTDVTRIIRGALVNAGVQENPVLQGKKDTEGKGDERGRFTEMELSFRNPVDKAKLNTALASADKEFNELPSYDRLENFDSQLAKETQSRAMYAVLASWGAILLYLWFRFGSWTFGLAAVLCLIHDLFFTMGIIAFCHYIHVWAPGLANALMIQDFKIDLPAVAALLTLVGYSVNDTIVVFDRIREVRGKNPELTPQMINDSVNQTLSRTLLTSFATWLVVIVLYIFGGEGVHLFAFCMVIGVIVGTYSSIYIASPLLLIFGEGARGPVRQRRPEPVGTPV